MQYELYLHRAGHGHCNCADFLYRGGACKHLRALRIVLDSWVREEFIAPFHYPSSESTARLLYPPTIALLGCADSAPLPTTTLTTAPSVIANAVALRQIVEDTADTLNWREDDEPDGSSLSDTSSQSDGVVDVDIRGDYPSDLVRSHPLLFISL